ncbi:MAG: DUF4783 domain-containing protein [Bacteroidales bacterium]|nr:DUF4783 domain-containing protein [Bacteroidales bacterium]
MTRGGFFPLKVKVAALLTAVLLVLTFAHRTEAQNSGGDVFIPIAKYIQKGDAERLSAWFAKNLEIEIFGTSTECSRIQATQIMKNFFSQYTPKSFSIIHKSGNPPMKYAIGTLNTGSENLRVVLLVRTNPDTPQILRIRIERSSI